MTEAAAYNGGPLLVLDGDLPAAEMIRSLRSSSLLVAADGASLKLRALGIVPDVVLGDLDVAAPHLDNPFFAGTRVMEFPDQDEYDGGKGLAWIAAQGHDRVTVLGAAGGMTDHVLNNFSFLARHSGNLLISLVETDCIGYFVRSGLRLRPRPGERISLIPMPRARLHTEGLEWNLSGEELALGERGGASNRATADDVRIRVQPHDSGTADTGCVVVFHYPASSRKGAKADLLRNI